MERSDQFYMQRVLELAKKGRGLVSPNPMVGAVIVKDHNIIGEGFHERAGTDHAEVVAIKNSIESVEGATLYCNLEPCCHHDKRTPPCVDLLIEKKIKRVVLCNLDPNPKVCGKGIKLLRAAGLEVELGLLEKEGKKLNETFFKFITSGLPFVHLKMAMSLDGKIALTNGMSKWITCEESRKIVHQMRFDYDAVMVGRETLNKDNPKLTIRDVESFGKCPYRIVIGNPSAMNLDSDLFNDEFKKKTIVLTEVDKWSNALETIKDFFYRNDIKILLVDKHAPGSLLFKALKALSDEGITSVLVEGGAKLYSSFIKEGLYDRISAFQAPFFMGEGINVLGEHFEDLSEVKRHTILDSRRVGVDQLLEIGN